MNTSGALILSNDGEFIYKLTHPKHEIEKTYIAKVNGKVSEELVQALEKGVNIGDYITKPAKVKINNYDDKKNQTEIEICIHEGKNRQVRKMLEAVGKKTLTLERIKIGEIDLKNLKYSSWRYLTKEEVDNLLNM